MKWNYIKSDNGEKWPEAPGNYLITVVADDGEKVVCTAEYDTCRESKFWEIDCRLTTVHGGKVGCDCSEVIAWSELPECA